MRILSQKRQAIYVGGAGTAVKVELSLPSAFAERESEADAASRINSFYSAACERYLNGARKYALAIGERLYGVKVSVTWESVSEKSKKTKWDNAAKKSDRKLTVIRSCTVSTRDGVVERISERDIISLERGVLLK